MTSASVSSPLFASLRSAEARRRTMAVALMVVIYGVLVGGYVNNIMSNAIADLAIAMVDDHSITIDPYVGNSNDVSGHDGHVYSGFGPGLSFMLVPVYVLIKPVVALLPAGLVARADRMVTDRAHSLNTILGASRSRVAVSALILAGTFAFAIPFAIGSTFLFADVCRRLFPRLPERDLPALMLSYAFGSIITAYATTLAHTAIAATLVWMAVAAAILSPDRKRGEYALMGALLGLAAIVDYPALVFAGLAGAFVVLRSPAPRRPMTVAALAAGGAVPFLAGAVYHRAAFGSFFTNSYRFRLNGLQHSTFNLSQPGDSLPNAQKLFVAFLHPWSGTVFYHPLMLLALPASAFLFIKATRSDARWLWLLGTATIGINLLIYCSYPLDVGPSCGPIFAIRYTLYSAPFAMLALAALLERQGAAPSASRKLLWAVAIADAVPVWIFVLYGNPVDPARDYAGLLAEMGPANYTLVKLHQGGLVHGAILGWIGFAFVVWALHAWWRTAAGIVAPAPATEPANAMTAPVRGISG